MEMLAIGFILIIALYTAIWALIYTSWDKFYLWLVALGKTVSRQMASLKKVNWYKPKAREAQQTV